VLLSLRVRDLAVLEEVEVSFGAGLTVLTGETGAGKSLVVDALSLLAGDRADPSLVRAGAERAIVEGAFVSDDPEVRRALDEGGFDVGEGPAAGEGIEVIVRREIAPGGKGRLFLNGSPAVLRTLSEIAPRLLVLYGQAEARELLDAGSARELIDRYAGCTALTAEVGVLHATWREAERERARIEASGARRGERLDLLTFQIGEIDAVRPVAGEEEALSAEKQSLSTVEKRGDLLAAVLGALESDEGGALTALAAARRNLALLADTDPRHRESLAGLQEALERASDVAATLSRERERLEANPGRLEEVAERLGSLAKLRRKYGPSLEEVLAFRERIGREAEELSDLEKAIARAAGAEAKAFGAFEKKALELSADRTAAAPRLSAAVVRHLEELAFLSSRFGVEVSRREGNDRWTAHGADLVTFSFAPNPGEPPRPLSKIASGGELSRVQLALAAALAEEEERSEAKGQKGKGLARRKGAPVRTFVFDEVDAGVSGATAAAVGKKLRTLAAAGQVLVVTHLPQVAAAGESHLSVAKETSRGRTKTRVTGLDEPGRVEAIASMLDGVSVGEAARQQALQLLRSWIPRARR
jgi:DNA repair protein RecN (Recombination protein N)